MLLQYGIMSSLPTQESMLNNEYTDQQHGDDGFITSEHQGGVHKALTKETDPSELILHGCEMQSCLSISTYSCTHRQPSSPACVKAWQSQMREWLDKGL